jgi:hypothetical protein
LDTFFVENALSASTKRECGTVCEAFETESKSKLNYLWCVSKSQRLYESTTAIGTYPLKLNNEDMVRPGPSWPGVFG